MNYQLVINMIPTKGFCTARSAKSTSTDLRLSFYKFKICKTNFKEESKESSYITMNALLTLLSFKCVNIPYI